MSHSTWVIVSFFICRVVLFQFGLTGLRIKGSSAWIKGEVGATPAGGAQGGEGLCLTESRRPLGEVVVEEWPWQVAGV